MGCSQRGTRATVAQGDTSAPSCGGGEWFVVDTSHVLGLCPFGAALFQPQALM